MKKKEKLILSVILLAAGTILNLFFTAALHGLMSRRYDTLTFVPLFQCLSGLFTERQQSLLFLSFEGFLALCCILFWVQNSRSYQSELVKVAGDIYTPAPSGQYQHGSSRWLKKEERDTVFAAQVIDPHNEVIRMLLDTGYDNLPFLEKENGTGNKTEDTGQEKAGIVPEDRTAVPASSPSVPINPSRAKEDEDFETVEYVVSPAGTGRQETGKEAEKTPSAGEIMEKEKAVRAENGEKGTDPYKLFPKGGIVVGMEKMGDREKLYLIGDDTHTLTIGATRSGKTRCLVIQSICSIALSGESLVISDPKAELYHYTADYLKKLGYEVICLDFKNPEKSTRYNLLQPVIDAINEDDMERAEMYAWDITNILVGDNTSNEKIWENGEKSTIAAAILGVVADNRKRPEYQNLTNVYWFIAEMSKSVGGGKDTHERVHEETPGQASGTGADVHCGGGAQPYQGQL